MFCILRIVWVGRNLKAPNSASPCHGQGHLTLAQAAPSPVQPGLGHFQGWSSHGCSVPEASPPSQGRISSQHPTQPCPLAVGSHSLSLHAPITPPLLQLGPLQKFQVPGDLGRNISAGPTCSRGGVWGQEIPARQTTPLEQPCCCPGHRLSIPEEQNQNQAVHLNLGCAASALPDNPPTVSKLLSS